MESSSLTLGSREVTVLLMRRFLHHNSQGHEDLRVMQDFQYPAQTLHPKLYTATLKDVLHVHQPPRQGGAVAASTVAFAARRDVQGLGGGGLGANVDP